MCGAGCRGAADLLRALSDRLKAPLIHSVRGKELMAYDDPRWMGGLGMIGTKAVYHAVQNCDLLLMVGTDYPYSNFLPTKGAVIQIDERPQVLGRRAPTALGVTGSARPTLKLLLERVAATTDGRFWDKVTHEREKWDEMLNKQADLNRSKHPSAGRGPRGQRRRAPRCDICAGHRLEHAVVRELDTSDRLAADHRLVQQCRGRHGARPGQWRAGAGSLAPGDRAVR
jgi:hypothetical protein